jgi:serine/threonine protein kinase
MSSHDPENEAKEGVLSSEEDARSPGEWPEVAAQLREELAPDLELVRPLGRGSVASVYLAREPALKRFVAVKVLDSHLAADDRARKRFEREAQASAALTHPNIVAVHRVGRFSTGVPYIIMQYVKGRTMEERLRARGVLEIDEARDVLEQVASAVASAHDKGIVHRDIRAGNVLYEQDSGRVFLSDFGIAAILASAESGSSARLTRTGELVGDPRYMSPEQLGGEGISELSDVYALGLLGYELITGSLPYPGESRRELIKAHISADPRKLSELRPGVDPGLEDLLQRCLAKAPRHRPSAHEISRRLRGGTTDGESGPHDILSSLKERRLPQIVVAYGAVAWGLLELTSQLADRAVLPDLAYQLVLVAMATGVPAVVAGAWFHGKKGEQRFEPVEYWVFGGLALVWLAASAAIVIGWLS